MKSFKSHLSEANRKIDEVLDRPGALDSYRKKADASGNKARNSATRKILQGPNKDGKRPDHSAELKTMKKRNKGQDMADRVAAKQFRKSIGKGYSIKKEEELSPKQKKIDLNKNGKVDGQDLAMLRAKKKK